MTTPYEPKKLSPEEMAELHALPDDALATAQEAAAFLRLKYNTLSWYRCNGGGPKYTRVGPKLTRSTATTPGSSAASGTRCTPARPVDAGAAP
ncbi:TPA: hypothetical protein ACOECD_002766 [Stenotrophomonas maltophilia]